jgi:hypothetical protein
MTAKATLDWHGPKVERVLRAAAADAVLVVCEYLLTESNAQVPLDEGVLERSGVATVDEAALKGAVSYDTPYAVRQHEDMSFRHAPGRNAKFLELAFLRNRRRAGMLLAEQIRRRVP